MSKIMMRGFSKKVEGVGVIEIVLILVILIGLVILFRGTVTEIIENVLAEIADNAGTFLTE